MSLHIPQLSAIHSIRLTLQDYFNLHFIDRERENLAI